MRELKFIFWSGEKMFYSFEEVIECLKQQMAFDQKVKRSLGYDHIGLHGASFMQFTGLLDKNGQELYESDLFYINEMQMGKNVQVRGKIVYKADRFEIEWIDNTIMNDSIRVRNKEMIKIGNVYENKL